METISSVETIIKKIDMWKNQSVAYDVLSGGITNRNYLIHKDGKKYVLRIPGNGTEAFIDRDNEQAATRAAAKLGISPDVMAVVEPEKAVVIPFIEGEVMSQGAIAGNDEKITDIVKSLKQVHSQAKFKRTTYVFDMIRSYTKMAEECKAFFPHDFKWMRNIMEQIEKAMERDIPPLAACHNDVLSENFIVDPSGKMWLLDWEYSGMNDPYFDLGDLAVEHPFNREQEELIIKTYCGEMKPHRLYRLLLHKLSADLWWSLWAMVQDKISDLDFDFYTYGLERYARFRMNYYNREFPTWLAGV